MIVPLKLYHYGLEEIGIAAPEGGFLSKTTALAGQASVQAPQAQQSGIMKRESIGVPLRYKPSIRSSSPVTHGITFMLKADTLLSCGREIAPDGNTSALNSTNWFYLFHQREPRNQ